MKIQELNFIYTDDDGLNHKCSRNNNNFYRASVSQKKFTYYQTLSDKKNFNISNTYRSSKEGNIELTLDNGKFTLDYQVLKLPNDNSYIQIVKLCEDIKEFMNTDRINTAATEANLRSNKQFIIRKIRIKPKINQISQSKNANYKRNKYECGLSPALITLENNILKLKMATSDINYIYL